MLPFFVYGTLLPGQPNFHYWDGRIAAVEPAIFHSGLLYDMGAYPMLIEMPEKGDPIHGALITIQDGHYDALLVQLDRLETYNPADLANSMYLRVSRPIQQISTQQHVVAWLYIGKKQSVHGMTPIDGDWATYATDHKPHLDQWWVRYHANPDKKLRSQEVKK